MEDFNRSHSNSTYHHDAENHYYYHDASSDSIHTQRLLAPAGGAPTVDHGVINVLVITLGMVLAIEVLRHQLDRAAKGNKFFHTVLELMYRELTTLGIVEFVIYLMHKYHENFNYQMEAIFVDVHFMLFYTAVFNAAYSCCVRILSGYRTDRSWVKLENIDVDHYIGIRKEFDRLESELKSTGRNWQSSRLTANSSNSSEIRETTCCESFREVMQDLAFKIRYPLLSRRYNELFYLVRFHELRAHFLDSNNLPPKFHISPYLKRSLTSVLLDFVHISPAAWILLMATANLLYFLSGMLLNATADSYEVEEFLMFIFFGMMAFFVVAAFVLFFKMKSIAYNILRMKLTIRDDDKSRRKTWNQGIAPALASRGKSVDQVKLFWFGNPHLIIVAAQYMQFGFALGLAMIFTYYKDFSESYSIVNPGYLLLALLVSYLIFLQLVSVIMPWYTMCTSMGEFVNKERLQETLAKMTLNEEIRKKEMLEEERIAEEEIARRKKENDAKHAQAAALQEKGRHGLVHKKGILNKFRSRSTEALDGPDSAGLEQSKGSNNMMAISQNESDDAISEGHSRRSWLRHARKKSLSDGIQFMSNMALHHGDTLHSSSASQSGSPRLSDAAAQQLHAAQEDEPQLDNSFFKNIKNDSLDSLSQQGHSGRRGHQLQKSVSDNVALMRMMGSTDAFSLGNFSSQNENHAFTLNETNQPGIKESENERPLSSPRHRSNSKDAVTMGKVYEGDGATLIKPSALSKPENPGSVREEIGAERKDTGALLNSVGNEKGPNMGADLRQRSNSLDAVMMENADEANMHLSGPPLNEKLSLQPDGSGSLQIKGQEEKKVINSSMNMFGSESGKEANAKVFLASPSRNENFSLNLSSQGSVQKADGAEEKKDIDSPLRTAETQPGKDLEMRRHARQRSNSLDSSMMQNADESGVRKNEEQTRTSSFEIDRVQPMLRRHERKEKGFVAMQLSLGVEKTKSSLESINEKGSQQTVFDLAKLPTKDLPGNQEISPKYRHRRQRSSSAGVSLMRTGLPVSADDTSVVNEGLGQEGDHSQPRLGRHERKERRRRMKTQSEGVAIMRSTLPAERGMSTLKSIDEMESENQPDLAELAKMQTKDLPGDQLGRHQRKERRRIMKTQSEGVANMRAPLPLETKRPILDTLNEWKPEEKPTALSEVSEATTRELHDVSVSPPKFRRPRMKSFSAGVSIMSGVTGGIDSDSAVKGVSKDTSVSTTKKDQTESIAKRTVEGIKSSNEAAKNKVRFALGKRGKNPTQEPNIELEENESFDSAASDAGDSDIEDVPEAETISEAQITAAKQATQNRLTSIFLKAQEKSKNIDLADFFQGSTYRIISLIFGPMACFFFVAMRVEIFNIYAGIFVDQTNIWYKYLSECFWFEVSLYCLMIIEMCLVFLVFLRKRDKPEALFHCSAATFGLMVNIMCLLLLLIAEMKRCCMDDDNAVAENTIKDEKYEHRLLAQDPSKDTYGSAPSKGYYSYDPSDTVIECCPEFGTRMYGGLGKIEPFTCLIALSPLRFIVAWYFVRLIGRGANYDDKKESHERSHDHHGPDPTDKFRDLWMTAIGVHRDIASSFGMFSSEMLQCMLGIYSIEFMRMKSQASSADPDRSDNIDSTGHGSSKHHESSADIVSDTSSRAISPIKSPALGAYQSDNFDISFDDFAYPKARLIRRMRRCERRLLPYSNEWMVVDVVLTSHELILFDALDGTEVSQTSENNAATNGGRGMALSDVAKGRKILDQFTLDDIDFVDIEHRPAVLEGDVGGIDVEANRYDLLEYWQGGKCSNGDYECSDMDKRWRRVDEDRLKVHFKSSSNEFTLYLRFMVDLKEMEHKTKDDLGLVDGDLISHVGTQTKVWCRTVARLRGVMNLKQDLPHFGNHGTGEMEDFVEVCERDQDGSNHNTKKKLHRRAASLIY